MQNVCVVAAHVEHSVDEHLHDLEHFAKVLECQEFQDQRSGRLVNGKELMAPEPAVIVAVSKAHQSLTHAKEARDIAHVIGTQDRTKPQNQVLALFVLVLHGVGQEFSQRRRIEAFIVHHRNDTIGRHLAVKMEELDQEVLLANLERLLRKVLLGDVVQNQFERRRSHRFHQLELVIDREHFTAVGKSELTFGEQKLAEFLRRLLVLEDAQNVFVVAAHVEHGIDECIHNLRYFVKVLEQLNCRAIHDEPLLCVAYHLSKSPDPDLGLTNCEPVWLQ